MLSVCLHFYSKVHALPELQWQVTYLSSSVYETTGSPAGKHGSLQAAHKTRSESSFSWFVLQSNKTLHPGESAATGPRSPKQTPMKETIKQSQALSKENIYRAKPVSVLLQVLGFLSGAVLSWRACVDRKIIHIQVYEVTGSDSGRYVRALQQRCSLQNPFSYTGLVNL